MRTVRSTAKARNRPRERLAWIVIAVLSGLLALAGRAFASPPPDDGAATDAEFLSLDDALAELAEETDFARGPLDVGALLLADDALVTTSGLVDAGTLAETHARARAASATPWGRLDVALAWRRSDRIAPSIDGLAAIESSPGTREIRREELWLVATWRH